MNSYFHMPDDDFSPSRRVVGGSTSHPNGTSLAGVHPLLAPPCHEFDDSSLSHLQGKRVAMVMYSYYPADPRPRRAAEALASRGMRLELICIRHKEEEPTREKLIGVDVRRLPIQRGRSSIYSYMYQYSAFLMTSAAILAARSITRKYDLVYVHNMPDILVLSAMFPKLFGAKVILDLHDPMPELMMTIYDLPPEARRVRLLRWMEKQSIALADSVVTVNGTCKKLFASRGCPPRKINVIMNSPDERIFQLQPPRALAMRDDTRRKPFVIMFHGSLVERNGLDLAVDALRQVRTTIPNAVLRVCGMRTPLLDVVMNSVREKGLQDAVEYLGPQSLEQLVGVIADCDVGIIPNQRNIFTELNTPTRIFEYLALGKPVVAPRAAGICEYFDDDSIVFFELGNAQDLAQKLKYVHSNPAEVTEVIRRGQTVYQEHLWSNERLRLVGIVAGLLGSGVP